MRISAGRKQQHQQDDYVTEICNRIYNTEAFCIDCTVKHMYEVLQLMETLTKDRRFETAKIATAGETVYRHLLL